MRAKSQQRLLAEKLRLEQGLSYKEIQAITGISKSTLSGWLKDIPLSVENQARIQEHIRKNQAEFVEKAWQVNRERHQKARLLAYQGGEQLVESIPAEPSVEELALAMLYLGEGAKSFGRVQMANTNPAILRYFIHALVTLYQVDPKVLTLRLNLIPAAEHLETEYQQWWLDQLGSPACQFQATQYDKRATGRQIIGDYHGVCTVTLNDTYLQQRLLGIANQYIHNQSMKAFNLKMASK